MTPRQRIVRAALLALLRCLDGAILPPDVWQDIEKVLKPLHQRDRSLADVVRPIAQELLEEYDERDG